MPARKIVLATGETYHIFNKSFRGDIFTDKKEYKLFLLAMKFYMQLDPPVKFSIYRQLKDQYRINTKNKLVNLIAYCLMPNHFHFILRQEESDGIKYFVQRLCNSYSHYFNIKHQRKGSLFDFKFKAVRIETQEQLIHLSRYIHLNPVTSYIVEDPSEYEYSSYNLYLAKKQSSWIDPSVIMSNFSSLDYKKFVADQKDYQRELSKTKHLLFD